MSARRPWAWPLVPVYRAVVAAKTALYRAGVLQTRKLGWPVVSVGSLSAGGAGKTPVVIALASMLREHGWAVDVLSRGYGRQGSGVAQVNLLEGRTDLAVQRFGDEPLLIAERTGAPVWVGADRFRAGEKAEAEAFRVRESALRRKHREWRDRDSGGRPVTSTEPEGTLPPPSVHLLDDGFQHRRLRRDFDVVLVTKEDLSDTLLPAGNLREPLRMLCRADAVVVREEEREEIEPDIRLLAGPGIPIWSLRRSLRFPAPLGVFSAGLRPVAFCAIARPEGFAAMLTAAGCGVLETVAFADHHAYDGRDMERLLEIGRGFEASGFVTTEKDAVKLSPAQVKRLTEFGPLAVVVLEAEFVFKSPVLRTLEAHLQPARPDATKSRAHAGSKPTSDNRIAPEAPERRRP